MDAIFIVLPLSIITGMVLYMIAYSHSYYLLIKKGYTPHGARFLLVGIFFLSIFSIILPSVFKWENITGKKYLIYLILILLISPALLLIYSKNYRPYKRIFDERRYTVKWQILGTLLSLISIISLFVFIFLLVKTWINSNIKTAYENSKVFMMLFSTLLPISHYFLNYKKFFGRKRIEDLVKQDKRAPVLFIRSFLIDTDPFFWGNINKKSNQVSSDLIIFGDQNLSGNLTFQQYFVKSIEENIGPLIGLGDPSRYLPLEGLNASYYNDDNWQDAFKEWVDKAACIISIPGNTEGLKFELNYILTNNLADHFFVFTPPKIGRNNLQKNKKFIKWLMAVEKFTWSEYANNMLAIGYNIQRNEPEYGTVIGFNNLGEQKILTTRAKYPNDYIQAIQKELKTVLNSSNSARLPTTR